jgi:plastocyanin
VVVALVALVSGAPVGAAGSNRTVTIVGDERLVPNALLQGTFRYAPGILVLHSGDKVTWHNSAGAPHTVSVVDEDELPTTFLQALNCPLCGQFLRAHGFPPNPARNPVLKAFQPVTGPAVLDGRGDSLFVAGGADVTATIGAPAGSELYFVCSIHPWMQGEIRILPALPV